MSSDTPRQPPDDRELEDFLAGRHPVGKAYRETSETEFAPRELDDKILTLAREAVRSAPPVRRRPRWVQPMAVAATLGLSLSVLMNLWRDPDTRVQMAPSATQDADLQRLEQGANESVPAQARAPEEVMAPQSQSTAATAGQDVRSQPEESQKAKAAVAREQQLERQEMKKKERVAEPGFAAPRAPVAQQPAAPVQAPSVASEEPSHAPKAALESRTLSAEDRTEKRDDAAPSRDAMADHASPRAFPATPPPPPAPMAAAPRSEAEAAGGASAQRSFGAAAKSEPPRMRGGEAAGAMAPSAAESASTPVPVEEWISRMHAALRDGDREKTRQLLTAFRKVHPEYPLPEDLAAFEKSAP